MPEINQQPIPEDGYDIFISYSMDPDYALSRRIENFLESFHKLKVSADIHLKPLQVCRDSSDFSLIKIKKEAAGEDYVQQVLIKYLQQSAYLLILCSHNAAQSKYVNFELSWFIQNKGIDKVLVAVTEGADLSVKPELLFPKPIIENNLQTNIFFDLRESKAEHKQWLKVRDLNEELTKLAANLNGESPGKILPAWRKEETNKLKRQRYISGIAAVIFLFLAILAYLQRLKAVENEKEAVANKVQANKNEKKAIENLRNYKLEQFQRNMRNGLVYFNAHEDSFARVEFTQAKNIVAEFPEDSVLQSQNSILSDMLKKCGAR